MCASPLTNPPPRSFSFSWVGRGRLLPRAGHGWFRVRFAPPPSPKQGSATIYAYLGERPVDGYPVTFAVSTSTPALAVVSGAATVTFDAHTWNDGIPVTVVGVATKDASGVVGYTVDFNLVKTDDPSYTESLLVSQVRDDRSSHDS